MKTFCASLLTCLFLFGCASDESAQQMAGDPSGASDEQLGPVDYAVDPVTNVNVVKDAGWKTTWKGRWYFFDSEENLKEFESAPTAYVTEDGRIRPSTDPVTHVEVRRNTPWKTTWKGDSYYFESEENLKKFEVHPTAYVTENGRSKEMRRKVYPYQVY